VIIDKITGYRVDIGTEGKAIPDALTKSQSVAVKDAACVCGLCLPFASLAPVGSG
jgi:hypothetical protein